MTTHSRDKPLKCQEYLDIASQAENLKTRDRNEATLDEVVLERTTSDKLAAENGENAIAAAASQPPSQLTAETQQRPVSFI